MFAYIARRSLQIIPTIFIISLIVFLLLALKPGDPLDELRRGNPGFTQQDYERLASLYGLDQPWYVRYWYWLYGIMGRPALATDESGSFASIHFTIEAPDFGPSRTYGRPAAGYVFYNRLPNTLVLSGLALLIAFFVAIPAGILSALKQHTMVDYAITIFNFIGVSIPIFWLGIMLIYAFAVVCTQCLPAGSMMSPGINAPDWASIVAETGGGSAAYSQYFETMWIFIEDRARHLILPVFALSILQMATWTRFMRSSVLEVLNLDYIRTAKSKGLSQRRVIFRHVARNAILPIITLIGLAIPLTMSGAVLTETVFNWPGMGRAVFDAILNNDFNVAMVSLMFISILVVLFSLLSDIAYALIDPRIRYD